MKTAPEFYNLKDDENHWCPVPNEIVERLCMAHFNAYESRVVWAVIRKTFGFHKLGSKHLRKKTDEIALSQFVKITGIDRRNCQRTLRGLTERRILSCVDRGAGTTKTYGLNFVISQWQLASIQTPVRKAVKMEKTTKQLASIQTPEVASIETPQLASIQTPTKETPKESLKEIPDPPNGGRLDGVTFKTEEPDKEPEPEVGTDNLQTFLSERSHDARGGAAGVDTDEGTRQRHKAFWADLRQSFSRPRGVQ